MKDTNTKKQKISSKRKIKPLRLKSNVKAGGSYSCRCACVC